MPDPLTAISTIMGSIKTAADIAQLLKNSDLSLEKAELKLKLAELIGALADAKIEIAGVQELLLEKESKMRNLEKAAEISNKLTYQAPYYWLIDGTNKDGPFCQQCRDKDGALIRLQGRGNGLWNCKTCKNVYTDSSYRQEDED